MPKKGREQLKKTKKPGEGKTKRKEKKETAIAEKKIEKKEKTGERNGGAVEKTLVAVKKIRIKKTQEIKKIQKKIKQKKHPVFRGRFGKRNIRRVSKEKWSRWRKPRGIDIIRKKEDGAWPKTGFRSPSEIRYRHPSGFFAKIVNNPRELEAIAAIQQTAAIISANVGEKKRNEILRKASELKIVVLNW